MSEDVGKARGIIVVRASGGGRGSPRGKGLEMRRRFVNRVRVGVLATSIALLGGVLGAASFSSEHIEERVGLFIGGALLLVVAARCLVLGTWVSDREVVIRSWLRTRRVPTSGVARFETQTRQGASFPAAALMDGSSVSLPMLERGIVFESRSPTDQWGVAIDEMNRLLSEIRSR